MSEITIEHGSGNVFVDLGFPDADTHLLKAQLVSRMIDIMRDRKLNQTQTARIVGLSQPDISRIACGHFRDISVERILRMLTRLGCDIGIDVLPNGNQPKFPTIMLEAAA